MKEADGRPSAYRALSHPEVQTAKWSGKCHCNVPGRQRFGTDADLVLTCGNKRHLGFLKPFAPHLSDVSRQVLNHLQMPTLAFHGVISPFQPPSPPIVVASNVDQGFLSVHPKDRTGAG